jgi:hypothetical protein
MASVKKSAGKSSANKAKAAKPNASAAKASTVKAGTAKANVKVKTASQPQTQTARRAEVDDGENMEIDSAEVGGIDGEGSDDVAEPKAKARAQTASKDAKGAVNRAPTSQRIATRPTNANQHPGEQLKALVKKRRTKEEMIEVRRQQAEQKERKEEAAKQKKVVQDKAIDRVAQLEMELANDAYNDTPLPRNRRILGGGLQFDRAVADHRESDQDYGVDDGASGPDQPGSDVIDDEEVMDAGPIDEIGSNTDMSDEVVPAKVLKRKGRAARANADVDVILETSASEGEDRPKKKAKGKADRSVTFVPSESEVEIVQDSEPMPHRKNPKGKATIRDAITEKKISGISNQNLRIDKADNARSSDAPGKLKQERYKFLTTPMLTFDETTLFYYTISANKGQKPSGLVTNWVKTVADAKAAGAAASNSRTAPSTLRASATSSAGLKAKTQAIKREGALLDVLDIGGLSDKDETEGAEREAAIKSPLKNGKRATSSVIN